MAGFEPAASTSQMWRDTGLRYIPFGIAKVEFLSAIQNKIMKISTQKCKYNSNCIITKDLKCLFMLI
jgi:hypothetical protein